jgi:Ca2+-binding RTX toxin-like protein
MDQNFYKTITRDYMAFINYGNPLAGLDNILLSTNDAFDVINGFGGNDTASYVNATSAVNVKLSITGFQNTGGSGFDRLISIENLRGSNFDDTLGGSSGNNVLDGGLGNDTVTYGHATAGVSVSLSIVGVAQVTGGAGIDTLLNFENLIGSNFNDTLSGNSGNNLLNGGSGIDTVSYGNASAAVTISLSISGPQATGGAGIDTLLGFENITGSNFNDRLSGDAGNNTILAAAGNDTLIGTFGNDVLDGEAGADTADYSDLGGPVTLGAFGELRKDAFGVDKLVKVETIIGSSGFGDTIDHSGIGSPGSGSPATGTNTDLSAFTTSVVGTPPLPLSFTVRNFENVIGSNFADSITGDLFNNLLSGGAGDDMIMGLSGGLGNDFIEGGEGADTLFDNAGVDIFNYVSAKDSQVGALRDVITGFATGVGGDLLGLAEIDANTLTAIDDSFTSLIVSSTFTANQQLRYTISGATLNLFGNIDGNNATAEFQIQINGLASGISFTNIIA